MVTFLADRLGQPVGVFSPLLVLIGVVVTISLMVGQFVIWPMFVFFFCGFGRRRHRRWNAAS
jgi:hypothetical protein